MTDYWRNAFGNPHSNDHIIGWSAAQAVEKSSTSVARLIGADAGEIVFTSGATEANNLALTGLARRAPQERNRILTSAIEHKCVIETARMLSGREGFVVDIIPVDGKGFVIIDALKDALDDRVLVVSIMRSTTKSARCKTSPRFTTPQERMGRCYTATPPKLPAL